MCLINKNRLIKPETLDEKCWALEFRVSYRVSGIIKRLIRNLNGIKTIWYMLRVRSSDEMRLYQQCYNIYELVNT